MESDNSLYDTIRNGSSDFLLETISPQSGGQEVVIAKNYLA